MPEPIDLNRAEINPIQRTVLEAEVIEALRSIYDPEIPVNIYDLGLIYDVQVRNDSSVDIEMTLTSPACPVAESLPGDVEMAVRSVPGVNDARVKLVWDPPYSLDMMPEHVRLELGLL